MDYKKVETYSETLLRENEKASFTLGVNIHHTYIRKTLVSRIWEEHFLKKFIYFY